MYGMVNQALRSLILEKMGSDRWEEICLTEKIESTGFSSFEQYGDEVTVKLIGHVCRIENQSADVILETFGRYWIGYAKKSEYQSLLTGFASNPIELIESLDALHSRLQLSFENLKAPSFWVSDKSADQITVHYKSQRQMGLQPFVLGLLKGVFDLYEQKCEIEVLPALENESGLFRIRF